MNKLGLVLEGGGMRGVYTMGVLDYFMEHDLYTDGVIGVSAGACHACSYASKQQGRAWRINERFLNDKRYMSMQSLIKTGDLFGADFIYNVIPNELEVFDYDTFHKSGMKLYAVCTDVESGKAVYAPCMDMKQDIAYVRASASLPLLSKIVEVNGKKLLDGGVADSIPIQYFQSLGYEKNIIVLTQAKDYRKGKNNLMPIIKRTYRKYPEFVKAMEERHINYNRTLDEINLMEKEGSVFVIRPSKPVEIGRLEKNMHALRALYEQGYQDAANHYEALLQFMNNERP